jgi:hypothetical protein
MQVLGIRASAQEIRYAILEKDSSGQVKFVNIEGEHRLKYPSTILEIGDKLLWIKQEFERIFRQNPRIEKTILKTNEFAGSETNAKRETSYIDAIILSLCAEKNIPVLKKLYSQIGTTSKKTKEHAEMRVGRTDKYWNGSVADAVNCAFWEIRRD